MQLSTVHRHFRLMQRRIDTLLGSCIKTTAFTTGGFAVAVAIIHAASVFSYSFHFKLKHN